LARGELIDRIAGLAEERHGEIAAETIARDCLRLAGPGGAAAAGLVRALLRQDARFTEQRPGQWTFRRPTPERLEPPVLLAAIEVPRGFESQPWQWRVSGRLWGQETRLLQHSGAERTPELEGLLDWLGACPAATDRPGALGRWLGAQERLHALPEIEREIIDLRGWRRLLAGIEEGDSDQCVSVRGADADPGASASRGAGAGADAATDGLNRIVEDLENLGRQLERVVAVARERGLDSWSQVALAPVFAQQAARDRVWETERDFGREQVEELPEAPGIYRFFDRAGRLLYIGKSANLRRRVFSYFRPLDVRSARRAELLGQLYRFEAETMGNELEALIRELVEIRRRKPEWNVQVALGRERQRFLPGERDLLLLLPNSDGSRSLFLLSGERVGRARLTPDADAAWLGEALGAFFTGGRLDAGIGEIGAPERQLVRRWLDWDRPGITVLRVVDFSGFGAIADAVAAHAGAGRSVPRDHLVAADYPEGVRESTLLRDGGLGAQERR